MIQSGPWEGEEHGPHCSQVFWTERHLLWTFSFSLTTIQTCSWPITKTTCMRTLPCRMAGETEGTLVLGGACQQSHLHFGNNRNNKIHVYFWVQSLFTCITNSACCIPSLYFIFLMSHLVLPSLSVFLNCSFLWKHKSFVNIYIPSV